MICSFRTFIGYLFAGVPSRQCALAFVSAAFTIAGCPLFENPIFKPPPSNDIDNSNAPPSILCCSHHNKTSFCIVFIYKTIQKEEKLQKKIFILFLFLIRQRFDDFFVNPHKKYR